ncbi:MAG: NAD-binding protein [Campylobacterota bacterium]|nr:NAD-binding protein [Campylobacterota bacterium]
MIEKIIQAYKEYKQHLKEEVIDDIKDSRNKIHAIIKHKNTISGLLAISTIVFGTIGHIIEGEHPFESILLSIKIFGLNFPTNFDSNILLLIAGLTGTITIFLLAIVFFIKDFFEKKLVKDIFSDNHTAVFGLGEINRSFLNSFDLKNDKTKIEKIVIIESNPNNVYLEDYKQKGFGIFVGDVFSPKTLELFKFENMDHSIIALGDDRHNIEFSKMVLDNYKDETPIKLVVHIQNKDLEVLFHSKFINNEKSNIHIKTFSFYEEVAKNLFKKHSVDGNSLDYIESNKDYKSIVLGDGELIEKIVYQIALLSHLPNENKHIVYIVDKKADELLVRIEKALYYKKENFPTFKLKAVNLDKDRLDFYENSLWHKYNLVNVIVAFDEEGKNLDTAVELYNRTYLSKAIDKTKMPKIIFGMYDEMLLSEIVNTNKEEFNNFYTYGNVKDILSHQELIDEETDQIAKLVNNGYGDEYNKDKLGQDKKKIKNKWYNTARFSDKLSSIAQAKHIDMKLKSMGFDRIKCECDDYKKDDLLKHNQKLMLAKLIEDREAICLDEGSLIRYSKELEKVWSGSEYEVQYFPQKFENLFEKMIRMEHNRWNAYHYLNGWKYEDEKVKAKKEHDCLMPLKDFDKDSIKITVIYDIYSFLYIPNYLAETGYKIVDYKEKK